MDNATSPSPRPPAAKKVCKMSTPDRDKFFERKSESCRRRLVTYDPKRSLKVGQVPKNFMERLFIVNLEKFRVKLGICKDITKTIVQVADVNKSMRTAVVEFCSEDVAIQMLKAVGERKYHFMNDSLTFHTMLDNDMECEAISPGISIHNLGSDSEDNSAAAHTSKSCDLSKQVAHLQIDKDEVHDMLDSDMDFEAVSPGSSIYDKSTDGEDDSAAAPASKPYILSNQVSHVQSDKPSDDTQALQDTAHKDAVPVCTKSNVKETSSVKVLQLPTDQSDKPSDDTQALQDTAHKDAVPVCTKSNVKETSSVKVLQLPTDFVEDDLVSEVHRAMWKGKLVARNVKPVILCEKLTDCEAIITFDTIENAVSAAKLSPVEYIDCDILLEHIVEELPPQLPTGRVRVSKLPSDFEEEDLIFEVHRAMWINKIIEKHKKPITLCKKVKDGEAVITFDHVHHAISAVNLSPVEYIDCDVVLEHILEVPPREEPTRKVKVSGIPLDFAIEDVIHELHRALWKNKVVERNFKPIIMFQKVGDSEAILTFDTIKSAAASAKLSPVEFMDCSVLIEHIFEKPTAAATAENNVQFNSDDDGLLTAENDVQIIDISEARTLDSYPSAALSFSESPVNEGTSDWNKTLLSSTPIDVNVEETVLASVEVNEGLPVLPKGERYRTDWPTFETLQLVHAVLLSKDSISSRATQRISQGWKEVVKYMFERKLYYSLASMKRTWKSLCTTYETCKETWMYQPFIGMYFDKEKLDLQLLKGLVMKYKKSEQPLKKPLVVLNKEVCGVSLLPFCEPEELETTFKDVDMTLLLISEYARRKAQFDDDKHRAAQLYKEIQCALSDLGYNVSAEDCCKRMAFLAKKYKSIVDMQALCTGSGAAINNWIYYDAMAHLFERSAVINPQKLVGAGSSSFLQIREVATSSSKDVRVGRKRPVGTRSTYHSSVSTTSYRESKLKMAEKFDQKMDRLLEYMGKECDGA